MPDKPPFTEWLNALAEDRAAEIEAARGHAIFTADALWRHDGHHGPWVGTWLEGTSGEPPQSPPEYEFVVDVYRDTHGWVSLGVRHARFLSWADRRAVAKTNRLLRPKAA